MPTRATEITTAELNEKFKDVDPDIDRKKNITSIDQYEDKQFELKKMELDLGIQVRYSIKIDLLSLEIFFKFNRQHRNIVKILHKQLGVIRKINGLNMNHVLLRKKKKLNQWVILNS